jgi:phage virion morphogenesis protein
MDKFKFKAKLRKLSKMKGQLTTKLSNQAVVHFKDNFRKSGFVDASLQPWKPRKPNAKRNRGRAILVDTGDLRRSIKVIRKTTREIRIGSDPVYAKVHNYGLRAGRGRGFKMPKRKFMGNSKSLENAMRKKINSEIAKAFK